MSAELLLVRLYFSTPISPQTISLLSADVIADYGAFVKFIALFSKDVPGLSGFLDLSLNENIPFSSARMECREKKRILLKDLVE